MNYDTIDEQDLDTNEVWVSEDGLGWDLVIENANFHPRSYHDSFVFKNKI